MILRWYLGVNYTVDIWKIWWQLTTINNKMLPPAPPVAKFRLNMLTGASLTGIMSLMTDNFRFGTIMTMMATDTLRVTKNNILIKLLSYWSSDDNIHQMRMIFSTFMKPVLKIKILKFIFLSFCLDITLIKCLKGLKSFFVSKFLGVCQWPQCGRYKVARAAKKYTIHFGKYTLDVILIQNTNKNWS